MVFLMVSAKVVIQMECFIIFIYASRLYLLSLQNSYWPLFLPSKLILTESPVRSISFKSPIQFKWAGRNWSELFHYYLWFFLTLLATVLYLHATFRLTYHSDICRGSLTLVWRGYYPPTQQDFSEAEWDLNYRFNEEKARSSFLADIPAVGWCLIISNPPMVYFPSAAVTATTFVG